MPNSEDRTTPPKAFVSYKFQDATRNEWVHQFCCDLRTKYGIDALLDTFEVDYGESFSDYMTSRIDRDCDAMLFVITPAAVDAVDQAQVGGVHFEMQVANARRIREPEFRIIGIYREGNDNSSYLKDHRYIDFRDDVKYCTQLAELANSLWGRERRPPLAQRLSADDLPVEVAAEVLRLRAESSDVRAEAADALGDAGDRLAVPYLIEASGDDAHEVRREVSRALGKLRDQEAVPTLASLLSDVHMDVRLAALEALGRVGGAAARNAVLAALFSSDSYVRDGAEDLLHGELRTPDPIDEAMLAAEVVGARNEVGLLERKGALNALRLIGDEAAVTAIVEVLRDDQPSMAVEAARALGDVGYGVPVAPLVEGLRHRSSHVRAAVCEALAKLRAHEALEALIAASSDGSRAVRVAAAEAMGQIGGEAAARALSRLQKDPDPQVAIAAAKALAYAWPRL